MCQHFWFCLKRTGYKTCLPHSVQIKENTQCAASHSIQWGNSNWIFLWYLNCTSLFFVSVIAINNSNCILSICMITFKCILAIIFLFFFYMQSSTSLCNKARDKILQIPATNHKSLSRFVKLRCIILFWCHFDKNCIFFCHRVAGGFLSLQSVGTQPLALTVLSNCYDHFYLLSFSFQPQIQSLWTLPL